MYQKLPEYLIVMNTRLEQQLDVAQPSGLVGLWEESGRGAKAKWTNEDIEYIENCLHQEQRTYNSTQLVGSLFVISIAWTRLCLGVHYPSDIVGGWMIEIAWSMVVLLMGKLFLTQLTSEKS